MGVLFAIAEDIRNQLALVDDCEDGQQALEVLQHLQGALEKRVEWCGLRVIEMHHEEAAIDAEIQRLRDNKATLIKRRDWLRTYLGIVLARADMQRIDGVLCKVRRQKAPPSVVVSLELSNAAEAGKDLRELLPAEFVRVIPEKTEIDKKGILQHYKQTGEIPGGLEIDETRETVVIW